MADTPSSDKNTTDLPEPEVLTPQAEEPAKTPEASIGSPSSETPKANKHFRRGTYRPSHKATFIGLAVVVAILAVNAGIITFVIKSQSKSKTSASQGQVTISSDALDKIGVNKTAIGKTGVQLIVNPDAVFNGKIQVGGDISVAGQLKVNGKITGSDASLTQLEAGNVSVSQLNVNGNGTMTNLNVRSNLLVTGSTALQGTVTISQLLTVNNNLNVSGSLAVGGTLSVNSFHSSSLITDNGITLGGHVVTQGVAPTVSQGPAVGSNGTVSISGNDAAGTVAVNTGLGAGSGILANVTFHTRYTNIPHVVVSIIGSGAGSVYISRNASGFSIGINGAMPAGGYAFDYIVEQ